MVRFEERSDNSRLPSAVVAPIMPAETLPSRWPARRDCGVTARAAASYFAISSAKYFAVSGSPVARCVNSFQENKLPGPKTFSRKNRPTSGRP